MKNSEEILPPDRYAIDEEVDDLFTHGDIKPVSNWSGIKYARLAAMLRVDDPQENCVSESLGMAYGLVKHNREGARRLARIYDRHFTAWKLFDDSPLSILQDATERVQRIRPEEIKQMNDEDQMKILSHITVLRKATEALSDAWCSARSVCEPIGG